MHYSVDFVSLGDLGEIVSGSTPKTHVSDYWGGDIPWITPADLTGHTGVYFTGKVRMISKVGYASCSTKLLPAGSILFSSRAPIGHCAVTTFPLCTNQGFKSIVPNGRLDAMYGFFALKHFTPAIVAKGRGATFDEVNKEIIEEFTIPLPPLTEQRRVAAILDKADRLRHLRRYSLQLSDTYLQSVFLQMFGDPRANSLGWEQTQIDEVVAFSQYGTSQKSNSEGRGYPVLGMGNVSFTGELDLSSLSHVDLDDSEFRNLKLEAGDVIFNRTNSTELVGKTAHWNHNLHAVLASYLIRLKLKPVVQPIFFVALLNTPYYKHLFQLRCKKAVGQSNISPTLLKEFPVLVPPLPLQQQFADVVQKHERLRAQQREAERQAEHLFQTLLHKAFAGELTASSDAGAEPHAYKVNTTSQPHRILPVELPTLVEQARLPLD